MREKYKYNYYLLILIDLLLLTTILMGCVTTGIDKKNAEMQEVKVESQDNENDDQIDNVRISEFILGVGDTIDISVYRNDELKSSIKITPSGRMMFPLIGDVQLVGKSIFKLRDELEERLSKYLIDPQVTINIISIQSKKIMVIGEVKFPGVFTLDSDISVVEAITNAGGVTDDAKIDNVLLARKAQGKQEVVSLNLKKVYMGDFSQDMVLREGDIIYVPESAIGNAGHFFSQIANIIKPFTSLGSGIVLWENVLRSRQGGGGGIGGSGQFAQ